MGHRTMKDNTGCDNDKNNAASVPAVVDVSFGKGTQVSSTHCLKEYTRS